VCAIVWSGERKWEIGKVSVWLEVVLPSLLYLTTLFSRKVYSTLPRNKVYVERELYISQTLSLWRGIPDSADKSSIRDPRGNICTGNKNATKCISLNFIP
jgi:hypothetical protein